MKEPSEVLVLENCLIKVFEENDYDINSSDNWYSYSRVFLNTNEYRPSSQIGIQVYDDDKLLSDCIIGAEGGGMRINPNSTLISYGGIVVCCSNTVFKLSLTDLNLEWKTKADDATCFGVHYLDEDYIVHGELEISRIDKEGKIVWNKSGKDIWRTEEAIDDFAVYDDYILATDMTYNRYKLDFEGNILENYTVEPTKNQQKISIEEKPSKPKKWWQVWK